MVDQNILEEIEKKSRDIMHSNEELAARLRQNQETISRFSEDFEKLRQDMAEEGLEPAARRELEKLKSELEDKKQLISDMIDDLKPIEIDLSRREDVFNALKQRVDDQSLKIESLSKDLLDNRKNLQALTGANSELRKQLAEKDGMVKVLKDKLTEKTTTLRDVDARNRDLEQQLDNYNKQVFALKNKIGAVENRVFATDEQNQKLLYEMLKVKERLRSAEQEIAKKDRLIAAQDAERAKSLEALRKEAEDRKLLIMKNHAKKVAAMNAAIDLLKAKLGNQQKVIEEKSRKENALMAEFGERMKELMATRFESPDAGIGDFSEAIPSFDEPAAAEEPEDVPLESPFGPEEDDSGKPSRMDEILPMIELAVDHGDDASTIKHSLKSSGYSEKDIEEAFSQLHIAKH
ncbi:hypothetical protein KY359_03505 [Candidatus Woesearchaeota archaeon]|nr:hypothetical protein [Candidatus Woesearchaeota archaeon]